MADNASHTINFQGTTPDYIINMIEWARVNSLDPTAINTSIDTSLDTNTDVVVRNDDYTAWCGREWGPPDGGIALVTCDYLLTGSGGKCDRHTVFLLRWFMRGNLDQSERRRVACHELGHTVGLKHVTSGASCVTEDVIPPPSGYYTTHDQNHLNDPNNY
jgi:hypothetical protein